MGLLNSTHLANRAQAHQWYYMKNSLMGEQQVGPISEEMLKQKALAGDLKPNTKIFSPTRTKGKWVYAKSISGVLQLITQGDASRQFEKNEAKKLKAKPDTVDSEGSDTERLYWKVVINVLLCGVFLLLPLILCYALLETFGFAVYIAVLPFLMLFVLIGQGDFHGWFPKSMLALGLANFIFFSMCCFLINDGGPLHEANQMMAEFGGSGYNQSTNQALGPFQFKSVNSLKRAKWIVSSGFNVFAGVLLLAVIVFVIGFIMNPPIELRGFAVMPDMDGDGKPELMGVFGFRNRNTNLLPCPDCGANVSKKAASCPQCGSPLQKRK